MPIDSLVGTFAYRFQGQCVLQPQGSPVLTLWLKGVGVMKVDQDGNIVGSQESTAAPVGCSFMANGYPLFCRYRIVGKYVPDPSNARGTAEVKFIPVESPNCAEEEATLTLVRCGKERFWFVSNKASSKDADPFYEMTSGEAVEIPDLTDAEVSLPQAERRANQLSRQDH